MKTRYVDEVSNQVLLRVDESDEIRQITREIVHNIDYAKYDAVVVSDYNKGFLDEEDIEYITYHSTISFVDSKKEFGDWILKADFIKINEKEYLGNRRWLLDNYDNTLVITTGKDGALLNHQEETFPIENEHEVRDLSGAGDTFIAALVASYVKNDDICESIRFANKCAAWVVSQKGVVTIDPEKI